MAVDRKAYKRDALLVGAAYVGVTWCSRWLAGATDAQGAALLALAAAPIIPSIASAILFLRHFRTMDELEKRIQVESFAAAALFVGLLTFSFGFLEDVAVPRISMIWVFPALIASWGVFSYFARKKYWRE